MKIAASRSSRVVLWECIYRHSKQLLQLRHCCLHSLCASYSCVSPWLTDSGAQYSPACISLGLHISWAGNLRCTLLVLVRVYLSPCIIILAYKLYSYGYSTNFYQSFQINNIIGKHTQHGSVHAHMQWQLLCGLMRQASMRQQWCLHALVEGHIPNTHMSIIYVCALSGGPSLHVYVQPGSAARIARMMSAKHRRWD